MGENGDMTDPLATDSLSPPHDQLTDDDDQLDGHDVDIDAAPVSDAELPYVALAGGLTGDEAKRAIEETAAAIAAIHGGGA